MTIRVYVLYRNSWRILTFLVMLSLSAGLGCVRLLLLCRCMTVDL